MPRSAREPCNLYRMFDLPHRRRIFLLRHAEAAYVRSDGTVTDDPRSVPLTELGCQQARKQAAVLASVPFDRAVCSGLPRTVETARLVLAGRDTPVLETEPALEEIRGAGRAYRQHDGAAWLQELANPWATAGEPGARFLGGEKFADFGARITPRFERIVTARNWTHLLLVLHGAVNRMILNHVLGLAWQKRVTIEQDNCCINIIDVDNNERGEVTRYLIRAVNLTGYNLNKSGVVLTTMEQSAQRAGKVLKAEE